MSVKAPIICHTVAKFVPNFWPQFVNEEILNRENLTLSKNLLQDLTVVIQQLTQTYSLFDPTQGNSCIRTASN